MGTKTGSYSSGSVHDRLYGHSAIPTTPRSQAGTFDNKPRVQSMYISFKYSLDPPILYSLVVVIIVSSILLVRASSVTWSTCMCTNTFVYRIGVSHLAGTLIERFQKDQPELEITNDEVKCVKLAG